MEISRIGTFTLGWGESLVWDDVCDRLYFVDCAADALHWLDDGVHRVNPASGAIELLSPHPEAIGGRCNDACADFDGNIITGKLNLGADPGSTWQYSRSGEWTLLDDDISNTNGPAALVIDDQPTLIVGDTAAHYFAYDYDADAATVGPRRIVGDVTELQGSPDGSTVDSGGASPDRLYVTSIGGDGELDGSLLVIDGLDVTGRAEPRAKLY